MAQGAPVALHETFVEDVTLVVGVGLEEVVTVVPEAVVASLPGIPVVDPPVVELALGDVVAERETDVVGTGVVFEALDTGFLAGDATAFT